MKNDAIGDGGVSRRLYRLFLLCCVGGLGWWGTGELSEREEPVLGADALWMMTDASRPGNEDCRMHEQTPE